MLNYNQERLNINDAIIQFQNQINSLTDDLERYKKKENSNEKFIFFKQQQISVLKQTLICFNDFVLHTNAIITYNSQQITKLNKQKYKLEGICLLHGITNLKTYLNTGIHEIENYVQRAYTEKWYQTPFGIAYDDYQTQEINITNTPTVKYTDLINKAKEDHLK